MVGARGQNPRDNPGCQGAGLLILLLDDLNPQAGSEVTSFWMGHSTRFSVEHLSETGRHFRGLS